MPRLRLLKSLFVVAKFTDASEKSREPSSISGSNGVFNCAPKYTLPVSKSALPEAKTSQVPDASSQFPTDRAKLSSSASLSGSNPFEALSQIAEEGSSACI